MRWERFVDVLPLFALALGYFGALYTETWRERRERERATLLRRQDVEFESLIELQDLLQTLPGFVVDLMTRENEVFAAGGTGVEAAALWRLDAGDHRAFPPNRALTLVSRILDDDLREYAYKELEVVQGIPFEWDQRVSRSEPGEVAHADRWRAASRLGWALGARLRGQRVAPEAGPGPRSR